MSQPTGEGYRTLTFGGPQRTDDGLPGTPAGSSPAQPVAPNRNGARRARQRRRAAQRRSRARMREGSEVLLAFLVLIGLTLLLIDLRTEGRAFAGPRAAAAGLIGPMQAGVEQITGPADEGLIAQNEQLQSELRAAAGDRTRLRELEELFGLVGRTGQRVVGASVVALDAGAGPSWTATIDRGSADGLAVDQAVLAAGGLGGRLITTAPQSSVVELTIDPRFVVGGRLAGSGEAGIVHGTGDPAVLSMDLLNPLTDVKTGDAVVSYGSPGTGPFPPGLAVGTVTDAGDPASPKRVLQLRPAADLTSMSTVAVVIARSPAQPAPQVAP